MTARVPVVITVDTEPDDVWTDHHSRDVRNVNELLRLQQLLDRYGARMTILVTYEVLRHLEAVRVLEDLADRGRAEIGAHLHPWDNPPFMPTDLDLRYHTFPHELPLSVYSGKMAVLTEMISRYFPRPISYRAGRYGLSHDHVNVLEELGYEVDTSVTPLCNWRDTLGLPLTENGQGGIDYRCAPLDPYHVSYADVTRPGQAQLLEVPITIYATHRFPQCLVRGLARMPEVIQTAVRRVIGLGLSWARPTGQTAGSVLPMLRTWMARRPHVVNIMFHSSELLLNGSPATRSSQQVSEVFQLLEGMLSMLTTYDVIEFCTLREAADLLRQSAVLREVPNPAIGVGRLRP